MKSLKVSDVALRAMQEELGEAPPLKRPVKRKKPPEDEGLKLTASMVLTSVRAAAAMQDVAEHLTALKAEGRAPVRLKVGRDKRGLIDYIDIIPKPTGD